MSWRALFNRRHKPDVATDRVMREEPNFLNGIANVTAQFYDVPLAGDTAFDEDIASGSLM